VTGAALQVFPLPLNHLVEKATPRESMRQPYYVQYIRREGVAGV